MRPSTVHRQIAAAVVAALIASPGYGMNRHQPPLHREATRDHPRPRIQPDSHLPIQSLPLVSVADEVAVGRAAFASVKRRVPGVHDREVTMYIDHLGARLAKHARGPRYPYAFYVANDRELNAFALPGGGIVVNRGALEAARNESQLAAILAHEIAHVSERHAAAQLTELTLARWGLGLLGALLGNVGGAFTAQLVAAAAVEGTMRSFSRVDERRADREAVSLLARSGWRPRAMIEVLEVLAARSAGHSAPIAFFSTHPAPAERLAQLRAVTRTSGGVGDSAAFQQVRRRLSALPPPPRSIATRRP